MFFLVRDQTADVVFVYYIVFFGLMSSFLLKFNDVLMYTSRGMTASNQFKIHGQLPLYGMTVSLTMNVKCFHVSVFVDDVWILHEHKTQNAHDGCCVDPWERGRVGCSSFFHSVWTAAVSRRGRQVFQSSIRRIMRWWGVLWRAWSSVFLHSSRSEMEKWLEDIKMAVELSDGCNGSSAEILSSSFTDTSKMVLFISSWITNARIRYYE